MHVMSEKDCGNMQEYIPMNRDQKDADEREIQSYGQGYVYSKRNIDVYFENKKSGLNMEQNTKHAAREKQLDRQVEKKAYTRDTDS